MAAVNFAGKIFGVGLGRTGTASLAAALHLLGFKTRHFVDYGALAGEYRPDLKGFFGPRLLAMLAECDAIANGTGLPFEELDRSYPDSRFILTIREEDAWLGSQRAYKTLLSGKWQQSVANSKNASRFINKEIYGSDKFDAERWLNVYRHHVKTVAAYFEGREKDCLVMDIAAGDGWDKLCPFLGLPKPSDAFPHSNDIKTATEWVEGKPLDIAEIRAVVPDDQYYILVDECSFALGDPLALPFIERDGAWFGNPPDDATAIAELERMRRNGAAFVVFAWPAFWYRDYYPGLFAHLRSIGNCIFSNERLIVFDLRY